MPFTTNILKFYRDLGETRRFFCFQGSQINMESFQYRAVKLLIELPMKKGKEKRSM